MIGKALDRINSAGAIVTKAEKKVIEGILNIPDEKARRVGQSVAAASLPQIR